MNNPLTISKDEALKMGLTHEGVICGVPCWMAHVDSNDFQAAPKFIPANLWLGFCNLAFDVASWFMREDQVIEFPMKVTGPIR